MVSTPELAGAGMCWSHNSWETDMTIVTTRNLLVATAASLALACAAGLAGSAPQTPGTSAQIDYNGFRNLTAEMQDYRAGRLVSLAKFQEMAREPGTIILDARSAEAYRRGHIDGAINLAFSDFTAQSLEAALGDKSRRILIYCNNNFENNAPTVVLKSVQLALNIQTFINLYGYGYRNVYELGDVVNFDDPKVRWVKN